MKTTILWATLAVLLAGSASAEGADYFEEPWKFHAYWRLQGGFSSADEGNALDRGDTSDTGALGGAVGVHVHPNVRIDLLEVFWRRFKVDGKVDGNVDAFTFFANAYYHPFPDWRISPFVGGGPGLIYARERLDGARDDDFNFAWNVRAGAELRLIDRLDLVTEYRFFMDHGAIDDELPVHELLVGAQFKFY